MSEPLFPILHAVDGTEQPPPGSTFWYIIGKDGIYVEKQTDILHSRVKVSSGGISCLQHVNTYADLAVDLLPVEKMAMILHFFREIYRTMKTEVNVLLFYNVETDEWLVHCPDQVVSAASVRYDNDITIEGWRKIGTIHSHCEMGTFHSGTDHEDENDLDGIHVVISKVTSDNPEMSVVLVVNGQRFKKTIDEYFAGISMQTVEEKYTVSERYTKPPGETSGKKPRKRRKGKKVAAVATPPAQIPIPVPVQPAPPPPASLVQVGASMVKEVIASFFRPVGLSRPVGSVVSATPIPKPRYGYRQVPKVRKTLALVLDLPDDKKIVDYPFPKEWLALVKRPTAHVAKGHTGNIPVPEVYGAPGAYAPSGKGESSAWETQNIDNRHLRDRASSGGNQPIGFASGAEFDTCYECLLPHEECECPPVFSRNNPTPVDTDEPPPLSLVEASAPADDGDPFLPMVPLDSLADAEALPEDQSPDETQVILEQDDAVEPEQPPSPSPTPSVEE